MKCIACGSHDARPLIDFGAIPQSGTLLSQPSDLIPLRRLAFEYCSGCALIRQLQTAHIQADYTDVARRTERQLPTYADQLVQTVLEHLRESSELVVEVGANDGTFLNQLAQAGISNRLAIEPSRSLAQVCAARGHRVENIHLSKASAIGLRSAYGGARVVICRHTLEHVLDPLRLLRDMHHLLTENGFLLIEVPGMAPIVKWLHGFELWDEHLTYFSEVNLGATLSVAGFEVIEARTYPHLVSQNIVCWARRLATHGDLPPVTQVLRRSRDLPTACERFESRWRAFRERMLAASQAWRRPVYAVGASHLQSNFLVFTGLGGVVSGLVDDDPLKIGRYVPLPHPTQVFPTAWLFDQSRVGTVLLTGFGYDGWMAAIRQQLQRSGATFFDPLHELARD